MTRPTCEIREAHGLRLLALPSEGPPILREAEADEILSEAWGRDADLTLIPAERLSAAFFQLETGLAGAILQKFANYHMRIVILGDLAEQSARSRALRDFIRESNAGESVWFLASLEDLERRLAASGA
ncbi:DUF4180 domain-containing protein [Neomegalonema perideroedes]|uniref:DUF4180 domain-containing protein n=1 Tax=Neomegalonema perideroedes TaxID=217219 RepID=UPI00035FF90B|nr:DUF4180 domain-containing protein [Neomegalonema perideroedes]